MSDTEVSQQRTTAHEPPLPGLGESNFSSQDKGELRPPSTDIASEEQVPPKRSVSPARKRTYRGVGATAAAALLLFTGGKVFGGEDGSNTDQDTAIDSGDEFVEPELDDFGRQINTNDTPNDPPSMSPSITNTEEVVEPPAESVSSMNVDLQTVDENYLVADPSESDTELLLKSTEIEEYIREAVDNNDELLYFRGIAVIWTDQNSGELSTMLRLENPLIVPVEDRLYWAAFHPQSGQFITYDIGRYDEETKWNHYQDGLIRKSNTFMINGDPNSGQFSSLRLESFTDNGVSGTDMHEQKLRDQNHESLSRAVLATSWDIAGHKTGEQYFLGPNHDNPKDYEHLFRDRIKLYGDARE